MVPAMILRTALTLTTGLLITACSTSRHDKHVTVAEPHWVKLQEGKASWYGGRWNKRLTASGERYDQNTMTAAHKSLAFGTKVRVTNIRNGKSCVVRINNRGPYVKGRVIDLSVAAAKEIGSYSAGVAPVKLEVIQ